MLVKVRALGKLVPCFKSQEPTLLTSHKSRNRLNKECIENIILTQGYKVGTKRMGHREFFFKHIIGWYEMLNLEVYIFQIHEAMSKHQGLGSVPKFHVLSK